MCVNFSFSFILINIRIVIASPYLVAYLLSSCIHSFVCCYTTYPNPLPRVKLGGAVLPLAYMRCWRLDEL